MGLYLIKNNLQRKKKKPKFNYTNVINNCPICLHIMYVIYSVYNIYILYKKPNMSMYIYIYNIETIV